MRRSSEWSRARRGGSKSSASGIRPPLEVSVRDGLRAIPDRTARPSDGILIQASVLGRLLGLRILRLEATVVLVPADVEGPADAPLRSQPRLPRAPERLPAREGPRGRGLADARRSIDEGAHLLAESRRDGR